MSVTPGKFTPFLLLISPPITVLHFNVCLEITSETSSLIRPSSIKTSAPLNTLEKWMPPDTSKWFSLKPGSLDIIIDSFSFIINSSFRPTILILGPARSVKIAGRTPFFGLSDFTKSYNFFLNNV